MLLLLLLLFNFVYRFLIIYVFVCSPFFSFCFQLIFGVKTLKKEENKLKNLQNFGKYKL